MPMQWDSQNQRWVDTQGSGGGGFTAMPYQPASQNGMRQTWGSTSGYTPDGMPIQGYGGSNPGDQGPGPYPEGGGTGVQMPPWQNPQLDPNTGRPYQNYPGPAAGMRATPPTAGGLAIPGGGVTQGGNGLPGAGGGIGGAQGMPGQQNYLQAFGGGPNQMQSDPNGGGTGTQMNPWDNPNLDPNTGRPYLNYPAPAQVPGTGGGTGGDWMPGSGGDTGGGAPVTEPGTGAATRGSPSAGQDMRYYDPNGGQNPWGQGVTPSSNPYAVQGPQVRWNPYTGAYEMVSLQEQSQNAQITGYDANGNPTFGNRQWQTDITGYTPAGQQTVTEQQRQYQNAQQLAQQQAQYLGQYGGQQTTAEMQRQWQNAQNQQAQQFGQGVTAAGITGQYNGQATLQGQQQQWSQQFQQQQADIQAAIQRAQQSGSMTDPLTGQTIQTLQGRAQQQAEQQQQFSQQMRQQELGLQQAGVTGTYNGQQTIAGRGMTLQEQQAEWQRQQAQGAQSGYLNGTSGQQTLEGELGRGRLGLDTTTADRNWQFQQAQMAANPENYAVTAALRGQAPWQQAMGNATQAQTGGAAQPQTGTAQANAGQALQSSQPSTPTQGGAASQTLRGGIPSARAMSATTYSGMRPDQRSAFNSAVQASGMSANDYQEQMRRYSPQGNRVGAATMR